MSPLRAPCKLALVKMAKKKKSERKRSWCWYCDREFDDDKILVQHQRMKHFQCHICHRKLNSASGLVIHMAQVHKETMEKVPNAVDGHDSPELEIYGMDGVPEEDIQRHYDGLAIVPYTKSKLIIGDASILPILAAQKVTVAAQLAESKNMTVQGDLGSGITSPPAIIPASTAAPIISPVLSSANSITSPPIPPAAAVPVTHVASPPMPSAAIGGPQPSGMEYWNNPYYMAAYYQYQSQYPNYSAQPQPQTPNPHYAAQYYQAYANYYQQVNANATSTVNSMNPVSPETPIPLKDVESEKQVEPICDNTVEIFISEQFVDGPFMIPSHVDSRTNKIVPGTIFTVPDLDRSLEEIRAEMKRYRV